MGDLASVISNDARLYLKPVQLSCQAHLSLPLAGGPVHFAALQVIARAGKSRIIDATFPVTQLDVLRKKLPNELVLNFEYILQHLTAPREAFFERAVVMGVLNLTPDSFSDGGDFLDVEVAKKQARCIFADGANILDIGAESTRPGATNVSEEEELERLIPILEIVKDLPGPVSLDTRKASVMALGLKKGISIINDISALSFDAKSIKAIKDAEHIVLMHAQGDPATMQKNPTYDDVLLDVYDFLEDRIRFCEQAGIERSKIIIDPGIGFGKTLDHNLALLKGLSLFQGFGTPVMMGVSRKRFIGEISGEIEPRHRLAGSLAAALFAVSRGVQIVRCHDVKETRQALDTFAALQNS